MQPKPMTDDDIQAAVRQALDAAIDFCESEVAADRIKAQRYFDGKVDLEAEEGRSKVVATKVRDTIQMVKPVLMRTFLQTDKPVEFVPRGPEDVAGAEQATDYIGWKFNESGGYSILTDVFHDALVKKVGIAKVWWDEAEEVEFDEYSNLTPEQFQLIAQDDTVEVLEQEEVEGDIDPMTGAPSVLIDAKVALTNTRGQLKVKSVPPEDFFISRDATTIEDARLVADRCETTVGEVFEMDFGLDFEEVFALSGTDEDDDIEDFERRGYDDEGDESNDPSMRPITLYEAYMKMDKEGTGIPRLYQVVCAGKGYEVLSCELADDKPYAAFECDPEPHTFFGRSLAEIIIDDQTAATSLLRSLLDNVHMSNNPRLVVNGTNGYFEDAMNTEIGAVLRARGDAGSAYLPLSIPFTAQATLPALQYYDMQIESKTGVSKSTLGMDADALQSTTAAGVNAAVQAGSAAAELIARNLAEGGMRRLFKLMLMLTRQHVDPGEMMRLNGQFIPVDPRSWSASMDLTTNVGLGTGKHEERLAAMQMTLQTQLALMQGGGMTANLVTLTGIRATLEDMLKLSGVNNADRYYMPMNPQTEQQIRDQMMRAMQQQQGQGDPQSAAFLQAEGMKTQQKAQTDMAKLQLDAQKLRMEDDRKRDEMEQDAILQAAKLLGEYGLKVSDQEIRQLQAQPRF